MQPLQYDFRDLAAKDNSITQAAAAPSNIHAAIPMRSATTASRNAWNYAHRNNHCCKTHRRNQTTPAAPAAHTRYLSSPAAATLHGKTQGFVLRLPPHNTRHATFMQPFQCDLQPQLQETHRTTHTGTTIVAKHIEGNQTTPAAPAAHTRYLSSPAAATLHRKTQGFVLRLPPHNTRHATFMQPLPFQCDLQPQLQETHGTTHTGTTHCCKTHRRNQTTPAAPAAHTRYLFIAGCSHFTRKKHKVSCSGFLPTTHGMQHSCSHSNAICNHSFKKTHRNYAYRNNDCCKTHRRNQTTPAAPAAHTRYLSSPAAATLHRKTQGFVLRLPPHNTRHATFMQPFQCDLQPQLQETHRTTHTGTTIVAKHIEGTKRPQPHPPHTRGTFHRRLQPLYTEKHKVSCSGFLPTTHGMQHSCSHSNAICTPLPHHFPSSPLPFLSTSLLHHFPSSPLPLLHHFPSSPLPFSTSLPHHFPSSPLPFIITSLLHHFPSSPLPFVTTSLLHHFPSSPLPFSTTSLPHHFPSSPLPFIITSLLHHFPSSPLPFFTTPLHHHFPSSPLPFLTTSLPHHSPSSSLPFFTTSLPHHFPSSPLPFLTTSLRHHPVS